MSTLFRVTNMQHKITICDIACRKHVLTLQQKQGGASSWLSRQCRRVAVPSVLVSDVKTRVLINKFIDKRVLVFYSLIDSNIVKVAI